MIVTCQNALKRCAFSAPLEGTASTHTTTPKSIDRGTKRKSCCLDKKTWSSKHNLCYLWASELGSRRPYSRTSDIQRRWHSFRRYRISNSNAYMQPLCSYNLYKRCVNGASSFDKRIERKMESIRRKKRKGQDGWKIASQEKPLKLTHKHLKALLLPKFIRGAK